MLLSAVKLVAQEASTAVDIEPIQTDRPDQTETPALVPKGMFQMENGFLMEKSDAGKEYLYPSSLLKYGVNENFELRVIAEWTTLEGASTLSGLNPVLVGMKLKLCDENKYVPKISLIAHLSIPELASSNFKTDYYAPEFRFTMQHNITDKIGLSYNLGAEWDGLSPEPTFIYTLAGSLSLTDKLGSYIELFGFAPQKSSSNHSFDGGLTYLINHNFMLDISGGFGLTRLAPDYYLALGFSFRI